MAVAEVTKEYEEDRTEWRWENALATLDVRIRKRKNTRMSLH